MTGEGWPTRNTLLWSYRYNTCISIMLAFSPNWLTDHLTDRWGILQAFNNLAIAAQPPVCSLKPTARCGALPPSLSLWKWDLLQMLLIIISGFCGLCLYYWLLWPILCLCSKLLDHFNSSHKPAGFFYNMHYHKTSVEILFFLFLELMYVCDTYLQTYWPPKLKSIANRPESDVMQC